MKVIDITFETIIGAVKHQIRCFAVTVLGFLLLGIAAGFLYAGRYETIAGGRAEPMQEVIFPEIRDETYYQECAGTLQTACDNLWTALALLSNEKTLTESQATVLSGYTQQLETVADEVCTPLAVTLSQTGALYVPEGQMDQLRQRYEESLEQAKRYQLSAETVWGRFTQLRILYYEYLLEELQVNRDKIVEDSLQMEESLEAARGQINELIQSVNQTFSQLAEENYLDILVSYSATGNLQITVNHTYEASSEREAFLIFVLLCVLVGICVGAFLSVYREGKGRR